MLADSPIWTLTCGDGPDGLLALGACDHVITDPPYDPIVDESNAADRVRDPGTFGFAPMDEALRARVASAIGATCRRWALVFCAYEEISAWRAALERVGMIYWQAGHFRRIGAKPQMTGRGPAQPNEAIVICHARLLEQRWNGGGKMAEWTAAVVRGEERWHKTQKPTLLMKQLVEDFTDPGELIVDIFAGSAATGKAAIGSGRNFAGFELDPEICEHARADMSMPLFDRMSEQLTFGEIEPKGTAAKARQQLDHLVLELVRGSNSHGIGNGEIATYTGADPKDLQRSLQRLIKRGALRSEGRTSSTRYFYNATATASRSE